MKKQLNVDTIQSELRGGSAFFPGYKGSDSPPPSPKPDEQPLSENQAPSTTVPPRTGRTGSTPRSPDKAGHEITTSVRYLSRPIRGTTGALSCGAKTRGDWQYER